LGTSFRYYDEIESTNAEASVSPPTARRGTVVVAESQLKGRGRLGRTWTSPPGKGLLFSVILRPGLAMTDAHLLTLTTGDAVAEAIEAQVKIPVHSSGQRPDRRQPQGRRDPSRGLRRTGRVDWVVAGIGINVNVESPSCP